MTIDTNKDMRWMTNNFLEAGLGSFSVSSEDSNYPLENLTDGSQRTKVFKFGGRFLIELNVNDKIYINAATYQIPAADYNSLNDLLVAANTVLAGIAAFFYDVDTLVVSISDATPFTLALSNQTEAAWETLGYTGIIDVAVAGGIIEDADEARVHWPYEEININFGYQAPIGFIAFIGDLAEELKIPEGAVIRIQGNTVNSFVAPTLDETITWYSTGAFRFLDDQVDSAWQYVKITIECPSGPFIPEIGYLYVGDYETFGTRNISTGFELTFEDPSQQSSSDAGQIYTNERTPYRVFSSLSVGLARTTEAAFLKRIYALKQVSVPFFIALDPTSYLSSTFDEHLAYMRFAGSPRYRHILRDIFELSFELREAL